jgi:ABC-2 type transport system ATP-binding protein
VAMVIETQGLSKSFKGVNALNGLDLRVPEHSIFGFLGPNGAGKSTTIKLLLGLIRPTAGTGRVFGLDIVQENVSIRKRVGYLAQDPRYYDHMTARETLRLTARFFYEGPAGAIEERVNETLDLVGLREKADRPIKGFSGGERQRLGIAQAQINYPDLLILDEPAASLDPMGRKDVLDIMERLRKHCTIFYSTHILEDVQRVSDTVAIMNKGQLVAQAPIGELLSGSGRTVYSIVVKGDGAEARRTLEQQPWVSSVEATEEAGQTAHWQIAVTDDEAAEARLLRLVLSDEHCTVTEFGRRRYNLEEVFLGLVGGEQRGR